MFQSGVLGIGEEPEAIPALQVLPNTLAAQLGTSLEQSPHDNREWHGVIDDEFHGFVFRSASLSIVRGLCSRLCQDRVGTGRTERQRHKHGAPTDCIGIVEPDDSIASGAVVICLGGESRPVVDKIPKRPAHVAGFDSNANVVEIAICQFGKSGHTIHHEWVLEKTTPTNLPRMRVWGRCPQRGPGAEPLAFFFRRPRQARRQAPLPRPASPPPRAPRRRPAPPSAPAPASARHGAQPSRGSRCTCRTR